MARTYKSPGAYVEEIANPQAEALALETTVPAFIGYTDKGVEKLTFRKIVSLKEFEEHYCEPDKKAGHFNTAGQRITRDLLKNELYYHMKLYFANGGSACYVLSLGRRAKDSRGSKDDFLEGLAMLAAEDEPTLLVMPELTRLDFRDCMEVYQAALAQAAAKLNRFVILDVPEGSDALRAFREGIGSNNLSYGAAYYPYLQIAVSEDDREDSSFNASIDQAQKDKGFKTPYRLKHGQNDTGDRRSIKITSPPVLTLPPGAAIAAIYCHTDKTRGIWKAPANVSLQGVLALDRNLSAEEQAELGADATGGKAINLIRSFPGKGILVWGARTLDGPGSEWKHVNVRRLCGFVEKSLTKTLAGFVFEPKEKNTWLRVTTMAENFLAALWRQGALVGLKPEEAFFVKTGLGSTMTPEDVEKGLIIVMIGLAVLRPAEFVIIRFSQKVQAGL